MNIVDDLLVINPYSRSGEKQGKIEKVLVHWVGNANTSAKANRNYFNNLATTHERYASSHYIIGLVGEIIRCIPDNEVAHHSGDYYMNRKSAGIECCHPDWNGKFNDKTYASLIELCVYLLKSNNLGIDSLIRHYDVTKKDCPHYYVQNNQAWIQLKKDVELKMNDSSQVIDYVAILKSRVENAPIRKSMSHTANNVLQFLDIGTEVMLKERIKDEWGAIPQGYINITDFDFNVLECLTTKKNGVPLRRSPSHTEDNVITYFNENTVIEVLEYIKGTDFVRCPQGYINKYDCK